MAVVQLADPWDVSAPFHVLPVDAMVLFSLLRVLLYHWCGIIQGILVPFLPGDWVCGCNSTVH